MLSVAERHKYILDRLNKYGFVRIADVANEPGGESDDSQGCQDSGEQGLAVQGARQRQPGRSARGRFGRACEGYRQPRCETSDRWPGRFDGRGQRLDHRCVGIDDLCFRRGDQDALLAASEQSLRLGVLLNEAENVHVVQLEGSVHKKSLSVLGEEAVRSLDDCICSKLFFGADGIGLEHGITTSTIDEAKLTRKMMKTASRNIILADSAEFGQRGFSRICSPEDIDVIITDGGISEQMIAMVEEAGVDLVIAK